MANFNDTLPGQYITPLITPEQQNDFTQRYDIPYTVLTSTSSATSGDTVTVLLGTTPTAWVIAGCMGYLSGYFTGSAVTSLNFTFGTTTNATCLLASTSVTGTVNGLPIVSTNGINSVATVANAQGTGVSQMEAVFTIQGAGATALTSGFIQLFVDLRDCTQPY